MRKFEIRKVVVAVAVALFVVALSVAALFGGSIGRASAMARSWAISGRRFNLTWLTVAD
jgi:hypothetical protein